MTNTMTRKDFEAQIIAKAWRDPEFKKRLLTDPKGVFEEELQKLQEGAKLPADLNIQVLEEHPKQVYLVLPQNPEELLEGELTDEQLESVAGGTIVVAVVWAIAVAQVGVQAQLALQIQAQVQIQVQVQVQVQVQAQVQVTS